MASTCYCSSTYLLRVGFSSGSSVSYHDSLQSKWMRPLAVPQKSKLIFKCSIDEGDPEKRKKKSLNRPLNVVGLGSKRNAILDFCLDSRLIQSSPIEFWTVCSGASEKNHFLRKMTGNSSFSIEGANDEILDDLLVENSSSLGSMILLVAGTEFGSDGKAAIKLLKAIKSNGGLAVSIVMKPFSFEGKRRQADVENLIINLAKVSNLSIVVDSDALLQRETVTLTEALRTTNNAVLLAIKSVSALLSDSYMKVLYVMPDQSELLSTSDVLKILQHSGKAVVGFGASYSIKASVERATFDCPFLSGHLSQVIQDVVICIIANSQIMDRNDVQAAVCSFRRIAKSSAKIIFSTVLDSSLEPNVIVSTIIITGVERNETTPSLSFWSQLSLRIPFPFDLFLGGFSSRSPAGQSALFPKEISCSKTASSTTQRTSDNDAQKPPTNDLFMTTKCQDGFIENDDGGFKNSLSCSYKQVADKTSIYSSTEITEVVDNLNIRKQLSDEEGTIKMDQALSFSKLSEVTRDLNGENNPYLDSTQGTCSNNFVHINNSSNPSTNPGAKSQAMENQQSISKREFSLDSGNEAFARAYMEHEMNGIPAGRTTQDERAKNKDESSDSECTGIGVRSPKDQASGRNNRVMPTLNKSFDNNCHSTESVVARNVGLPMVSKMDEDLLCWNGELDISAEAWANIRDGSLNNSAGEDRRFPIGVKFVSDKNGNDVNRKFQAGEGIQIEDGQSEYPQDASPSPWNGLADAGLSAMMDICYAASAIVFRNDTEDYQKQGSLSDRAASMLESERGLKRKWSPIIEMQYRGGIYRGRCQGGLPEGKGRLSYKDGSFYDGIWRHGKRCGIGAFYYSSGDVFQGSWRDDLMHGKGWFYFKNGDRWFAEFWKGNANGEGRYYSKHGDVYFGHFQENWRHGEGLYIEPNGTRWYETWEHGVLVTRTQTDSEK